MKRLSQILWMIVTFLWLIASNLFSADGILTSSGPSSQVFLKYEKPKTIEEDVQDIVLESLNTIVQKTLQTIITQQKIDMMQPIASYILQDILMQMAQRSSTLEIIKEAYRTCLTNAYEMKDKRVLKATIKDYVHQESIGILQKVFQDPVFQVVLEESLKQGMMKQQQIMTTTVAERQAKINAD